MKNLGTIKPLLFDRNLIISLSKEWINKFSRIPTFDVIIDKRGRLCIVSKEALKR